MNKYQAEVIYKDGTTDEQRDGAASFIKKLIEACESAHGTTEGIPECIEGFAITRSEE